MYFCDQSVDLYLSPRRLLHRENPWLPSFRGCTPSVLQPLVAFSETNIQTSSSGYIQSDIVDQALITEQPCVVPALTRHDPYKVWVCSLAPLVCKHGCVQSQLSSGRFTVYTTVYSVRAPRGPSVAPVRRFVGQWKGC